MTVSFSPSYNLGSMGAKLSELIFIGVKIIKFIKFNKKYYFLIGLKLSELRFSEIKIIEFVEFKINY